MKKRIFSLIAVLGVLTSFCLFYAEASETENNLIVNGDFETGDISSWYPNPGQFAGVEDCLTHSGNFRSVVQTQQMAQTFSGAEKNKTYLASAWVLPSVDNMRIAMQIRNINHKPDNSDYWVFDAGSTVGTRYNTDKWNYMEYLVTTPDTTEDLEMQFVPYDQGTDWFQNNTKIFYVDDVYFGEIVPAAILNGDEILQSELSTKQYNYSIGIGNSQGGTLGVNATDVSGSLTIDENSKAKGVTFENGVLTLPCVTESFDIVFSGSVSGNVNGEQKEFALSKTVKVAKYDSSDNKLKNGGFEAAGTSPWTFYPTNLEHTIVSDDSKISGKYSLHTYGQMEQEMELEPDTYYVYSATVKPDTATLFATNVWDYVNNNWLLDMSGNGYVNTELYNLNYVFKTADNTKGARFGLNAYSDWWVTYGSYTVDNMKLLKYDVTGAVNGNDVINNGLNGTTVSYSVLAEDVLGNSVNTSNAVWSLKDAPEGVTINSSTGELAIAPGVTDCEVTIEAEFDANVNVYQSSNTLSSQPFASNASKVVEIKSYDPYGNLVINGDFESGTSNGWNGANDAQAVSENAKSGNYALYDFGELTQEVTVEPNSYYITSLNAAAGEGTGFMSINIWDDSIINPSNQSQGYWKIDDPIYTSVADGYHSATRVIKTGTDTSKLRVQMSAYQLPSWGLGYFYVDDIYMAKLKFDNTINGADSVCAGEESSYTNELSSNLGSNDGIGDSSTNAWEIVGAPKGISVDENGKVTVSEDAQVTEFTLKLTSSTNIKAFADEDQIIDSNSVEVQTEDLLTSVATKTIAVKSLLYIENSALKGDFSEIDASKSCQYAVAFYNGESLVSVFIENEKAFSLDFDNTKCDNVKVFTWDSIDAMNPIRNSVLTLDLK